MGKRQGPRGKGEGEEGKSSTKEKEARGNGERGGGVSTYGLEEICGDEEEVKEGRNDPVFRFGTRRAHQRLKRKPLDVPPDILSRKLVVENINWLKMSPLAVVCLLTSIIVECGRSVKVVGD